MPPTNFPEGVVMGGRSTATVTGQRQTAIADQANAAAAPTQAEFNSLVGKVNLILAVLRKFGLISE